MSIPKLQVALDTDTTAEAVQIAKQVHDYVDIVEAGTLLIYSEGMSAIRELKNENPDKIILADPKCADAGQHIGHQIHESGASIMTCINAAQIPTMVNANQEITVQVELYRGWDYQTAQEWLDNGIKEVCYHQSRDAKYAGQVWGPHDQEVVKKLIEMGFSVSVTGGLHPDNLKLFAGTPVSTFIVGRAITKADDPAKVAKSFKDEIQRIWG